MKNFFLISTGGSGGHVIPATILFDHLSKEANLMITTDQRGLKFLDQSNYNLEIINTPKLNNIFFLPINFVKIIYLTLKTFFLLKRNKINKIFSTGGYMSLPIILAAKLLKLDIYLIEPNIVLGRSNRIFLGSCKKIFCYTNKIKNFPNKFKNKIVVINPLVKENIYKLSLIPKTKKIFTILIVGGSQGANIFDNKLKNTLINLSKKNLIKIIQQTSEKNINYLSDFYKKNNIESRIFSFEKNFANIIHEADLCISRAGASTLAELSVLNVPFIAVPLPTSKDNHQLENANFYKDHNCCWVIEQKDFENEIERYLKDILSERNEFLKKKENLNKLNFQNSWINVNQKILKNLNEN